MKLVNETNQAVAYTISCDGGGTDSGTIKVDGFVELPNYDNQTNVTVGFKPEGADYFSVSVADTDTGKQIEMAVVVEPEQE